MCKVLYRPNKKETVILCSKACLANEPHWLIQTEGLRAGLLLGLYRLSQASAFQHSSIPNVGNNSEETEHWLERMDRGLLPLEKSP